MPVLTSCRMCGRPLDVDADPLSGDCGGDCWGCVGWVEARMGGHDNPSVEMIDKEIAWGWREPDGSPKSPESIAALPTQGFDDLSKDSTPLS